MNRSSKVTIISTFLFVLLLTIGSVSQAQIRPRGGVVTDCSNDAQLKSFVATGGSITFNCGTATIPVVGEINVGAITAPLTIDGGGVITLNGGGLNRLLNVNNGKSLTLQNITLTNGTVGASVNGGAVIVTGTGSSLRAIQVQFTNNTAGQFGGAVSVENNAAAYIFRSSFKNNQAGSAGGAIIAFTSSATADIANSTFITNNAAGSAAGGAIRAGNAGIVNVTNVTFSNNSSTAATGDTLSVNAAGTLNLRNSILVGTQQCGNGTVTDQGGNLSDNGCTGVTSVTGGAPTLGAETGFPIYLPLEAGSNGIDDVTTCEYVSSTGNTLFANGSPVSIDQPGDTRPAGVACDIGADEVVSLPPTNTPTNTPEPTSTNTPVPTATNTPVPTATNTPDPTATATDTPLEGTPTPENTPTETPTEGPTNTPTNTAVSAPGSFTLTTPGNNTVIRKPSAVTAITWTEASGAATYRFVLFRLSENTRPIEIVLDIAGLTPAADTDPLACATGVCTLTVSASIQAELINGLYSWTVVATNTGGNTEASNAPFFFKVFVDPIELIVNGGFEIAGATEKLPANWVGKNLTGDRRRCDANAASGSCYFRFKGRPGENSRIQQIAADISKVGASDILTLTADITSTVPAAGATIRVRVTYANGTKETFEIVLTAPTDGYDPFTVTYTLTGTPTQIRVRIQNKNTSGQIWVDNVSLIASPPASRALIPLP